MHNLRLNLPFLLVFVLLVLVLVLTSTWSSFLGTTSSALAQSFMLHNMIPASSSCFISLSTNSPYLSGTVYGLEAIGGPSAGMSNSMRFVLPISVVVWDTMLASLTLSGSFSLSLASSGISESGIDLDELFVSGSNCKLVLANIFGNSLAVALSYRVVHLIS